MICFNSPSRCFLMHKSLKITELEQGSPKIFCEEPKRLSIATPQLCGSMRSATEHKETLVLEFCIIFNALAKIMWFFCFAP